MTRGYRPCGACGALIDVSRGCKHWKAEKFIYAARQREVVDQFRRTMTRTVTG
jgi:hypothetical protein